MHGRKLGKNIGRARVRASGTGVQPHAQPKAVLHGVGTEGNWIGLEVRLCLDSLEWGMKIIGYERLNFLKYVN